MYWSASSSESGDQILAKLQSMCNHITNIHEHPDIPLHPKCLHENIVSNSGEKDWLHKGEYNNKYSAICYQSTVNYYSYILSDSLPFIKLHQLMNGTRFLNDVKQLSIMEQTASIESFNSLVLEFTPKLRAYSYIGMLTR